MNRAIATLRTLSRIQVFLLAMALVPFVGLSIVTIKPPPEHGYQREQAFLLVLALMALALSRKNATGAVLIYCSLAMLPVGSMIQYYREFTPLVIFPLGGVFIVSGLTRHASVTAAYTIVASITGFIIGLIYNDLGGAYTLSFITAIVGGVKAYRCRIEQAALTRLGIIERGLAGYVGGRSD